MHITCQKAALLPQDGTVTTLYVFMLIVRALTHFLSHPRSSSTRAGKQEDSADRQKVKNKNNKISVLQIFKTV